MTIREMVWTPHQQASPDPVLLAAVQAAQVAHDRVRAQHDRAQLEAITRVGADGTPTMLVDDLVEADVIAALAGAGVNVLSEEEGLIDIGSSRTVLIDPVDGSANAAHGVPLACASVAMAVDGVLVEGLTRWLATGRMWWARTDLPSQRTTTGRTTLDGAAVSLLRPHAGNASAWGRVADRAGRIRVLGCSTLDAALVADGASDAFADADSDTHRIVDLAAAAVIVPAAGGCLLDVHGRAVVPDVDLTRRWSGVAAATRPLAEALVTAIRGEVSA